MTVLADQVRRVAEAFAGIGPAMARALAPLRALLPSLPSARTVRLARRARRRHLAALLREARKAKRVYPRGVCA